MAVEQLSGGAGEDERFVCDESLADRLLPMVVEACGGRLGSLERFEVSWQHSGARTAVGTWQAEDELEVPVVVKVPVGPRELFWTRGLDDGSETQPTPRVYAFGESLDGHDLGWLVEERLSGPPLGPELSEAEALALLEAAVSFQARAEAVTPSSSEVHPRSPDWDELVEHARRFCREGDLPESHRWSEALRKIERALPLLKARWSTRPVNCWCHGDLHGGNAMRRSVSQAGGASCVLIDLAMVHAGCWVEDAVYLERLYWGRRERMGGVRPVREMRRLRRERGLEVTREDAELARVRRVLAAAGTLIHHARHGDRAYLTAAVGEVERSLSELG